MTYSKKYNNFASFEEMVDFLSTDGESDVIIQEVLKTNSLFTNSSKLSSDVGVFYKGKNITEESDHEFTKWVKETISDKILIGDVYYIGTWNEGLYTLVNLYDDGVKEFLNTEMIDLESERLELKTPSVLYKGELNYESLKSALEKASKVEVISSMKKVLVTLEDLNNIHNGEDDE